jgi:hypothetical protein
MHCEKEPKDMALDNVSGTTWPSASDVTGVPDSYRMVQLQTENARLQQLIAELLIKNHELREMLRRFGLIPE